jgi:hypothetical protein
MELAGNKDKEAVPFIVEGVKKETDPAARLRMAASLYQLSPNDGQAFMVGLCQEKVGKRSIAINAAQTLTLLDKSGKAATDCLPNLMSILNDSTDPASQAGALSVLGAIARTLPDSTRDSVRAVAIRYSTSKDFELMVAAIRALASDKNSQSLDALRHAAQVETIPGRRDYILNQLQLASR